MIADKKKIGFRSLLRDADFKTISKNSISLLIIQGTNVIMPLIVLPFLIERLGMEKIGVVMLAQALVSYWIIFTDYGFQISTTREVILNRGNSDEIARIVNNTIKTKLVLCVAGFLLYSAVIYIVPVFSQHAIFYLLSYIMVLGQSLVPTWFFQGIEKMQFLTYINFISKTFFLLLIFVLIKSPEDYILVTILYGLGNFIAGIAGIAFMFMKFSVRLDLLSRFDIKRELKKGWYIFVSNISTNAYLNSNILFLGLFHGEKIAGLYGIAEKIIHAAKLPGSIYFQATFPKVCLLKEKGDEFMKNFFKRYFVPFIMCIVLMTGLIILLADHISIIMGREKNDIVVWCIRALSFIPLIVSLNMPANQSLLAYNYQKSYMSILLAGSVLNILLNLALTSFFSYTGAVISIVSTELFITVGLYTILRYRHPEVEALSFQKNIRHEV